MDLDKLSDEAVMATIKGVNAHCPGCMIEHKIPTNNHGRADHEIAGRPYECHANSEAWKGVPEFEDQAERTT